MSRASYNNPQFQPFQSGSTLCYPSKDYANMNGGSSLISTKPGKNYFKTPDYKVSAENLKTLIGKSYVTSAGGAKKRIKKVIKKKTEKPVKKTMKKKRVMKKGGNPDMEMNNENPMDMGMMMSEEMTGGKKTMKRKVMKKPVKKTMKKKSTKKVKKGGAETEGATGMPSEFYSGKKYEGYSSENGNGVMSAYGPIVAGDAGVGNLAPFNTSRGSAPLTMMKTGGKKKAASKKGGYIPSMSDAPFKMINNVVNGASKKIDTFSKDVKNNYNKSVAKIQQMRTGMARLGGAKKKRSLKGGIGSDFISTLNSRGPANYPDSGEKMFRVFNKTGEYIPNSQLAYAAAPKLTGGPKVRNVTGFSSFEDSWATVSGGAKRKSMKKKVGKKPVKGKKSTPKKKVGKKC